jgi:diguanylate cyclase (GGDEF)-like protein/PAS domain S-box-containing protein
MSDVPAPAALFRTLFERSSDAVVIADEQGRICWVNDASERLLGHAPGTLVGEAIELLVPARFTSHRASRESYWSNPRARGMATGMELKARHHDGRDIPVDIALTPLVLTEGRWVAATMRDMRGRAYSGETLRVHATALRSAANGVVITDRTGTITWVNPAACRITGYAADELIGHHTRTLKSGRHEPAFYEHLWATVLAGETWSGTIINRRKDGGLYHEEQTIAPVVDDAGGISHFIAIKQDVTDRHLAQEALAKARAELESLNQQLREQVIRDPLTNLYNRRYFDETIARDVSAAARKKEPIAVLAIDVDHFKRVNDVHGHAAGDAALVSLAQIITRCVRTSDIACRFGGEEFVVTMPGADRQVAHLRAEALRTEFERTAFAAPGGAPANATVSIGLATMKVGEEPITAVLARADAALYAAKRSGRNRVVLAHD